MISKLLVVPAAASVNETTADKHYYCSQSRGSSIIITTALRITVALQRIVNSIRSIIFFKLIHLQSEFYKRWRLRVVHTIIILLAMHRLQSFTIVRKIICVAIILHAASKMPHRQPNIGSVRQDVFKHLRISLSDALGATFKLLPTGVTLDRGASNA